MAVTINLATSNFARSYKGDERIHQEEWKRVTQLVRDQLEQLTKPGRDKDTNPTTYLTHYYNTITIFGGRGTGKSSFLYSLLDHYQHNADGDSLVVLPVIDPTMIEEKNHVFLLVVSLINDAVKKYLDKEELTPATVAYLDRKRWENCLENLSLGLPSLDKVGQGYDKEKWEDAKFIMGRGMEDMSAAFNLERNFHDFVELALEIMNKKGEEKKAFLLAFDDIDVDMDKGWRVLETLRKYLTTQRVVCLLSGDLKLYGNNVRDHQWMPLANLIKHEDASAFQSQVNALASQYLLKIWKAENRIQLLPLWEMIHVHGILVSVKYPEQTYSLEDLYCRVLLLRCGVDAEINVFTHFLLNLPIRSQIQFLKTFDGRAVLDRISAFLSDMYAHDIPVEAAVYSPSMTTIAAVRLLHTKRIIRSNYLLIPNNTTDVSINSCLMGLNILFAHHAVRHPFVVFDYMLRVAYFRNLVLPFADENKVKEFIDYATLTQDVSLKNIVGLAMAFMDANGSDMAEHFSVFGLAAKQKDAKKEVSDRIDVILKTAGNSALSAIGSMPLVALSSTTKKGGTLYYSVFALLASIAELLKTADSEDAVRRSLADMALLRYYARPDNDKGTGGKIVERQFDLSGEELGSLNELAKEFVDWRNLCPLHSATMVLSDEGVGEKPGVVPVAYMLGRIATRFYSAVKNVDGNNLGEQMEVAVACFLNACLVEEAAETKPKGANFDIDNPVSNISLFGKNVNTAINNHAVLPFSAWMMRCPLLVSFIGKPDFELLPLDKEEENTLSKPKSISDVCKYASKLKGVLEKVALKGSKEQTTDEKPTFLYGEYRADKSMEVLLNNGFESDYILFREPVKEVVGSINEKNIFKNRVTEKRFKTFRTSYLKKNPTE